MRWVALAGLAVVALAVGGLFVLFASGWLVLLWPSS